MTDFVWVEGEERSVKAVRESLWVNEDRKVNKHLHKVLHKVQARLQSQSSRPTRKETKMKLMFRLKLALRLLSVGRRKRYIEYEVRRISVIRFRLWSHYEYEECYDSKDRAESTDAVLSQRFIRRCYIIRKGSGNRHSSSITLPSYWSLPTCAEQTGHLIERPVKGASS